MFAEFDPDPMDRPHWFGVDISFECPSCKHPSEGKLALSVTVPNDYSSLREFMGQERLMCCNCHQEPSLGVQVRVQFHADTPEKLKQLGYPLPLLT
jgi:hypothetical protein